MKLHSSALAKKSTIKTIFFILAKHASINLENGNVSWFITLRELEVSKDTCTTYYGGKKVKKKYTQVLSFFTVVMDDELANTQTSDGTLDPALFDVAIGPGQITVTWIPFWQSCHH